MEINKIYNENCLDTMAKMPDNFIDLTVTSPPYDDLRTYNGYSFDFENVAKELFRVTKKGGVLVWVVGDATVKGSETGTSFRQALYFKEIGFNLHDTMIWHKNNPTPQIKTKRYTQCWEYMFIFSKGSVNFCNYIFEDCLHTGKKTYRGGDSEFRKQSSDGKKSVITQTNNTKILKNLWTTNVGTAVANEFTKKHPATFPEQLANDHIISWSNENDLVYDPFMGSGTTAKMAILNNRKYIGSEISAEYCKIIEARIKECGGLFFNSFETEMSNEAGT